MQIKSIRVQNYRSIVDSTIDKLSPLTILIGPNNSGKSSFIGALSLFGTPWKGGRTPAAYDFCAYSSGEPIRVTLGVSLTDREVGSAITNTLQQLVPPNRVAYLHPTFFECIAGFGDVELESEFSIVRQGSQIQVQINSRRTARVGNKLLGNVVSDRLRLAGGGPSTPLGKTDQQTISNFPQTFEATLGVEVAARINILGPVRKPSDVAPPVPASNFQEEATDLPNALYYHAGNYTPRFRELEANFKRMFPHVQRILVPPATPPDQGGAQLIQIGVSEGGIDTTIPLAAMSSGMKEALAILARLTFAPDGAFVAIEEPEIHFHSGAMTHMIGQILSEASRKQCLIVTHSSQVYVDTRLQPEYFWRVTRPDGRGTVAIRCATEGDIDEIEKMMLGGPQTGTKTNGSSSVDPDSHLPPPR